MPDLRRLHLNESERSILAGIVAERPRASCRQIALIFEARVGRMINRSSIQKLRDVGGYKARPGNGHLTDSEKDTLRMLVEESGGEASYQQIAEQFEAIAGRPIIFQAVWRFAVLRVGSPRVGKGRRAKTRTAAMESRRDDAAARKLARAKVDRSPRVGHPARLHLEGKGVRDA